MLDSIFIITLCSIPCFASGLALYRMAHHGQVIRKLARSTVPSISQSVELEKFTKQISDHFSAFQLCAFFSFAWVAMAFMLLFLCGNLLSLTTSLVLYACYTLVGVMQGRAKKREKATVFKIVKTHPGFIRSELLVKLQSLQKLQQGQTGDAVAAHQPPSFENPTLKLKLDNLPPPSASVRSLSEEKTLRQAHHLALIDDTLSVDEPMIAIFKDKEQTLRVFMAKADLVWQPTVDESGNTTAGRVSALVSILAAPKSPTSTASLGQRQRLTPLLTPGYPLKKRPIFFSLPCGGSVTINASSSMSWLTQVNPSPLIGCQPLPVGARGNNVYCSKLRSTHVKTSKP